MTTSLTPALATAESIIVGKPHQVRLALACLLAGGHLLIEDIPGVGKTTLAHTLATVLGLEFKRVQFTSDLLPADIVGVSVFDRESDRFRFHPGPVFTQVLLADEINRASPKTQSALLEAMAERQVSADGETRRLPQPFFVIATQNPQDQIGTFALPESQLDRFLMRIELGYPDHQAEMGLLSGADRRQLLDKTSPALDPGSVRAVQREIEQVHTSPALLEYILHLVHHTRRDAQIRTGLSPRAGLALKHCSQAWAFLQGRDLVLPEDVQAIFVPVVAHRLQLIGDARDGSQTAVADSILQQVAIP